MREINLDLFTKSVEKYFAEFNELDSLIIKNYVVVLSNDSKYLAKYVLDYTAAVSIGGDFIGAVYVTFDKQVLSNLINVILGSDNPEHEELVDMAGEIVNTLSGNAREFLGAKFNISIPFVISGNNVNIEFPRLKSPIYILPCSWHDNNFSVCVSFKNSH